MSTNIKAEQETENQRRAEWAAANPGRCANCGGTGMAWDYIYALGRDVLDKCADCNGTGRSA